MLDRAIAFGPGEVDIGERHIILEIDETLLGVAFWRDGGRGRRIRGGTNGRHILAAVCGEESLSLRIEIKRTARLAYEDATTGVKPPETAIRSASKRCALSRHRQPLSCADE